MFVLVAAYTGMRAGEIAGLRVRDVDLFRRRIHVTRSVSDVNGHLSIVHPKSGKGGRWRSPSSSWSRSQRKRPGKAPNDLLFTSAEGATHRHRNWYERHFRPAVHRVLPADLAGKFRFHDLRHTCASLLSKQGMPIAALSRHLGHSSIDITVDRYGHMFPDEHDRVADALDAMFEALPQPAPDASVTPLR